ncbi:hypothetical protein [Massilia sp. TSP1-1-2]
MDDAFRDKIGNELDLPMAFCGLRVILDVDRRILLSATCPP